MSIHTILSQEIDSFIESMDLVGTAIDSASTGSMIDKKNKADIAYKLEEEFRKTLRSFVTRIVEEVGKDVTNQVKLFIKDQAEHEVSKEHTLELMPSLLEHIFDNLLDTKLQKMKG